MVGQFTGLILNHITILLFIQLCTNIEVHYSVEINSLFHITGTYLNSFVVNQWFTWFEFHSTSSSTPSWKIPYDSTKLHSKSLQRWHLKSDSPNWNSTTRRIKWRIEECYFLMSLYRHTLYFPNDKYNILKNLKLDGLHQSSVRYIFILRSSYWWSIGSIFCLFFFSAFINTLAARAHLYVINLVYKFQRPTCAV